MKTKHSHRRECQHKCGCRRPRQALEACTSCPHRQVRFLIFFHFSFSCVVPWCRSAWAGPCVCLSLCGCLSLGLCPSSQHLCLEWMVAGSICSVHAHGGLQGHVRVFGALCGCGCVCAAYVCTRRVCAHVCVKSASPWRHGARFSWHNAYARKCDVQASVM